MSGVLLKVTEVSGKNLAGKSGLKLFIVDMINTGDEQDRWSKPDYLLVFKIVLTLLSLRILVLDHPLLHCYPHH